MRYKLYCADNGFNPMSAGEFTKYIKKAYELDNPSVRVNGKVVRLYRRIEE